MTEEELNIIEQYFNLQYQFLADKESFDLVNELIAEIRRQDEALDRALAFNRHYYHHFFNGDIDKMRETFAYLIDNQ